MMGLSLTLFNLATSNIFNKGSPSALSLRARLHSCRGRCLHRSCITGLNKWHSCHWFSLLSLCIGDQEALQFLLFQFGHSSDLPLLTCGQRSFWGGWLWLSMKEVTSLVFPALDCAAGPCFLENTIYAYYTQLCFWLFRLAAHFIWAVNLRQWCHKKSRETLETNTYSCSFVLHASLCPTCWMQGAIRQPVSVKLNLLSK